MSDLSPGRSRWAALTVLCAGMLMIILDGNIVSVALPVIQHDLGFSPAGLAWTVNAYMIPFGGLLLLAGRLGDLLGRRRMLLAGLAVFTGASLLCGLASGPELLIAARFVQGAGGAMASAVSLGMIVTLFTDPWERARALGAFSFVGAAGASIGSVLGGVLTESFGWHSIFLINLPIGIAAVVGALRLLPADRGLGLGAGADVLGGALVTAGLMLAVYTIIESGGRSTGHTLGFGALSLALLAGFVARQATAPRPLLPLRMFASRNVSGANLVQILMVGAMFSFQFLVVLYMQRVLGYDANKAGLALLPAALVIGAVTLLLSARLNARFGERAVVLAGLALLALGLAHLTRLPVSGSYLVDLLPTLLLGSGFGLAIPALTALAMSDATQADSGLVSGLCNTAQTVGGALGLAVLSTLAATRTDGLLAGGTTEAAALTGGYRLAFGVGAALVGAAIPLALLALRARSARRTSEAKAVASTA
ncbi:MFS transporter [Actinomadura craniellae]|nr:MFS transporter [Actinomadura craniellae]